MTTQNQFTIIQNIYHSGIRLFLPKLSVKACISRIKYRLESWTNQRSKDIKPVTKRMTDYVKMLNEICDLAPPLMSSYKH